MACVLRAVPGLALALVLCAAGCGPGPGPGPAPERAAASESKPPGADAGGAVGDYVFHAGADHPHAPRVRETVERVRANLSAWMHWPQSPRAVNIFLVKPGGVGSKTLSHGGGAYLPAERALVVSTERTWEYLRPTLVHEGTHIAVNDAFPDPPVGLDEGVAEFWGGQAEAVLAGTPAKPPESTFMSNWIAMVPIVAPCLQAGVGPRLADLLAATQEEMNAPESVNGLRCFAWSFVGFLIEGGQYRKAVAGEEPTPPLDAYLSRKVVQVTPEVESRYREVMLTLGRILVGNDAKAKARAEVFAAAAARARSLPAGTLRERAIQVDEVLRALPERAATQPAGH